MICDLCTDTREPMRFVHVPGFSRVKSPSSIGDHQICPSTRPTVSSKPARVAASGCEVHGERDVGR